jgi:hypothetical protein
MERSGMAMISYVPELTVLYDYDFISLFQSHLSDFCSLDAVVIRIFKPLCFLTVVLR